MKSIINQEELRENQSRTKAFIKFISIVLLIVLCSNKGYSQQKNISYFKLCVTNEKKEILLVKYKGIWELAGKKYVDTRSISEFTSFMAEEMGVNFKELRLRGLFTFYYNNATNPILFNYYSAEYESGKLTVPPGCTDIAWFSLEEALKIIPFETMRLILDKMFEQESYVWGASMRIHKEANSIVNKVTLEQDFYPLSE
jgi:hypothetical protein